MIFSNSPVKNITERLNPLSQKNKISRLKFERKSDYRTFLKFIKDNTREIESIDLPSEKKKTGLLLGAGLGLGLILSSLGRGKGEGGGQPGKADSTTQLNTIKSVLEKTALESKRRDDEGKQRTKKITDPKSPLTTTTKTYQKNRFNVKGKKVEAVNQRKAYVKKREKEYRKLVDSIEQRRKKIKSKELVTTGSGDKLAKVTSSNRGSQLAEVPEGRKINKKNNKITTKSLATVGGQGSGDNITESGGRKNITKAFGGGEETTLGLGRGGTTGKGDADTFKYSTRPKPGEITQQQKLVRNFNKNQIVEPTRISDQNFKNLSGLFSGDLGSDDLDNLIKEQRGYDSEGRRIVPKTDTFKYEKPEDDFLKFIGSSREDYDKLSGKEKQELKQIYDENKLSKRKTRATIDRSKFFEAPEIPKKITPKKLNNFDKFNRFSNRVLNSPVAKFTTFLGGMFSSPKLMILKSLMEPTPLADGTLEGKPGVGVFSDQLMFDEDMAVNIFMPPEGRESMIPFNTGVNIPSVTTPTDLQIPKTNVFVDYEFNSTEDLFFIKMAGS